MQDRIDDCIRLLEELAKNPARLADFDRETRLRLQMAAGRLTKLDPRGSKQLRKELRRRSREEVKAADEAVLARTGIRELRQQLVYPSALLQAEAASGAASEPEPLVQDERRCYVCKTRFRELHHFYDQMCPPCAAFNWDKRNQTADLTGRVALVTGARVKIGYQAALKLLRAGARVLVTTRFPRDAAERYATEPDFEQWADRVEIHGLDMRHTPSVEAFARFVVTSEPRLDFVLNNACQTVRRPPAFYAHLLEAERQGVRALPAPVRATIDRFEERRHSRDALLPEGATFLPDSVELSQLALLPGEEHHDGQAFPDGHLDADLQQVDLRGINSWRLPLADVSTVELLEVHLVNAVAPFVLNARLKPLMVRERTFDKHIVNVSAMEGQFYRAYKTDKHPHTNMAKAGLNMLTRTSAIDYAADGIYMNSVDTGWVTDEDPVEIAARKVEVHRFSPPLDIIDGAARICDPIFHGLLTGEHVWGQFLKDYAPIPW